MWCGKPFCPQCGYQGPEIVWASVGAADLGFLVQDAQSLALRAVSVPAHPDFVRHAGQSDQEFDALCAARVAATLGGLGVGERVVPASGLLRVALGSGREPTLLCPVCRRELGWWHTRVS